MTADRSDRPEVIAPPPLIALTAIALGLACDWLWRINLLRDLFSLPVRLVIGGALIGAGAVLAIFAERTFRRIGTNAAPWKPALQLASTGLYAHIRNPMYLGLALFVLGVGVAMGSAWTLAMLGPAALVLHYGVVLREERYLEERFGEDYRTLKARVPRYGWRS